MIRRIEGIVALKNKTQPLASWSVARRRIRSGRVVPASRPGFRLAKADIIFTMGSCFARNIEEHLQTLGCRVPCLNFKVPRDEHKSARQSGILNIYTPPIFRQELAWADRLLASERTVSARDCEAFAFGAEGGLFRDLGLSHTTPVSFTRLVERRHQLFKLYKEAFTADCFIMTPGLAEVWFDKKHNRFTNAAPIYNDKLADPDRFHVEVLDHKSCVDDLTETIRIVRSRNPDVKVIITVSPVPLRFTFTNQDIIVANRYSKAVLRSACEEVCRNTGADYFPSFEAVVLSRKNVWESDRRHVTDSFVRKIVSELTVRYFDGKPSPVTNAEALNLVERVKRIVGFLSPR